jgi:hypothetical protein
MAGRARRWIVGSLAPAFLGLLAAASLLGFWAYQDAQPRDVEEHWLPGPDGLRLRSHSWTEPGSWVDRETRVHEYSVVDPSDGSEQRIGNGDEPLGEDSLHTRRGRAELVVAGRTFRRTASGSWVQFDADGDDFLYRNWSPLPGAYPQDGEHVWRYRAPGQTCRIQELAQEENRLVSACRRTFDTSYPAVTLVFTRADYESPWTIDRDASFAASPPPEHPPFPPRVAGSLVVLRVAPALPLRGLDSIYEQLVTAREQTGVEEAGRVPFTLADGARPKVAVAIGSYHYAWYVRGAWLDSRGWPVLFWSEMEANEGRGELLAVPFDAPALVHHAIVTREEASYLTYLQLDAPASAD